MFLFHLVMKVSLLLEIFRCPADRNHYTDFLTWICALDGFYCGQKIGVTRNNNRLVVPILNSELE